MSFSQAWPVARVKSRFQGSENHKIPPTSGTKPLSETETIAEATLLLPAFILLHRYKKKLSEWVESTPWTGEVGHPGTESEGAPIWQPPGSLHFCCCCHTSPRLGNLCWGSSILCHCRWHCQLPPSPLSFPLVPQYHSGLQTFKLCLWVESSHLGLKCPWVTKVMPPWKRQNIRYSISSSNREVLIPLLLNKYYSINNTE